MKKVEKDKYWIVTTDDDHLLITLEDELVAENYQIIERRKNILFVTTVLDVDSLIKENASIFTSAICKYKKKYMLFVDVSSAVHYYLEKKKTDRMFYWYMRQAIARGMYDSTVLKGEYKDEL